MVGLCESNFRRLFLSLNEIIGGHRGGSEGGPHPKMSGGGGEWQQKFSCKQKCEKMAHFFSAAYCIISLAALAGKEKSAYSGQYG